MCQCSIECYNSTRLFQGRSGPAATAYAWKAYGSNPSQVRVLSPPPDMDNPISLSESIAYQHGAVVSKEIYRGTSGTITLFAFGKDQGLSAHTTPYDAFATVVDGQAMITVGEKMHTIETGSMIHMPANTPHELKAKKPLKCSS